MHGGHVARRHPAGEDVTGGLAAARTASGSRFSFGSGTNVRNFPGSAFDSVPANFSPPGDDAHAPAGVHATHSPSAAYSVRTGSPGRKTQLPSACTYGVKVARLGWWKSSTSMRPRSVAIAAAREDHDDIDAVIVASAPPG